MKINRILILSLAFLSQLAYSQPVAFHRSDSVYKTGIYPRYFIVDVKAHYGRHATTGVDILEQTIEQNPYSAFEARVGLQGYGWRAWHQLYRYPTYGLGIYQAYFIPQDNQLGNPSAIYMFFNKTIIGNERISAGYDFEFGISYNFLNYDPVDNPEQQAIGTAQNAHFQLGAEVKFRITKGLDGAAGLEFTHFSNGRIRTPQKGINLPHGFVKMRYHFPAQYRKNSVREDWPRRRPEPVRHDIPVFKPIWEFYIFGNVGMATPESGWENRSIYYTCASAGIDVARHYSYKGKIGIGLDWFYDESVSEEYQVPKNELSAADKIYYGVHVGHGMMVHRWTFVAQMGLNLTKREVKGNWWGRFGLRYDLSKQIFFRGTLKIPNGWKADFIEIGGGYYFLHRTSR